MSKIIQSNTGTCQALKPCISPGAPGLLINDGLRILADNNASSCGCGAFENCTRLGPEARRSLLTLKFSKRRSRRDGMMVYRYSNCFYRPSTEYSVDTSVLEILIFNLWVLWNHSTSSLYTMSNISRYKSK